MRLSHLVVLGAVVAPVSAAASVVTLGSGFAASCYHAADARHASPKALADCNHALAEEALPTEDRVATLVNRGILFLRRQNLDAANADFDAALAINPKQAEAWLNKAIVHARFGNSVDAMPHVAKALEHGTRKPAVAYFVRAMANEDSGNLAAAYYDFKRAQELDPSWQEPQIELQRFKVQH